MRELIDVLVDARQRFDGVSPVSALDVLDGVIADLLRLHDGELTAAVVGVA